MKRKRFWHSMWLIVPATVLLPPLGLFMLWRSPRRLVPKMAISVFLLLLLGGGIVGAVKTDVYGLRPRIDPSVEFDVSMNRFNRYRTPQVLPLERKIFGEVVQEMMKVRPFERQKPVDVSEVENPIMVMRESKAFQVVADRNYMDVEDVAAIYLKVSSKLGSKSK